MVGLLDCGMAGRIDPEMREQLETFIQTGVDKDTQEMTARVLAFRLLRALKREGGLVR